MESPVTVGIVGAGFGRQVHVPAFRAHSRCEIRAICASHRQRAETAARELGIPSATDDWRELVNAPDIQALALAVPPSVQAPVALAAAEAGKHLFCEKPLALNLSQARAILAAAHRSQIVHTVDFIFPELPAWQKARELLQSSALGPLRHVALTWRVETYTYRAHAKGWKTAAETGGGTLNNFVSHTFYYLEWLLGPITRLSARLEPRASEVEARVEAWLDFSGGYSGSVSVAADAFLGLGHRLEIYGESGTLVLENTTRDYARGFRLSLGTRATSHFAPVETAGDDSNADGRVYPVSRIAGRFLEAIDTGGQVCPGLAEGVRAQELLDAARLAHQQGSWQPVALR